MLDELALTIPEHAIGTATSSSSSRVHPSGLSVRWPARSAAITESAKDKKSHALGAGRKFQWSISSLTAAPAVPRVGLSALPYRTTSNASALPLNLWSLRAQISFIGSMPRIPGRFLPEQREQLGCHAQPSPGVRHHGVS